MLVIARKVQQRVRIMAGDKPIWVSIHEIDRNKVRICFDATREFEILREELIGREPKAGAV